jgi:hypothetical protein
MVGTSCLLGEADERHTPCFGGIGFRRRNALQRSGVLPMRLRVDRAWLRHSGLAAHWAVTTSSGGAGRRRAHSRTRQRQMSSTTYGGRKSRGVGMMLLWRTKAASAEQKNGGGAVRHDRYLGLTEKSTTAALRAWHAWMRKKWREKNHEQCGSAGVKRRGVGSLRRGARRSRWLVAGGMQLE